MRFDQTIFQISHKYGIGSLEMENKLEIQFWCCPGMGHLYPIVEHSQLFQNKMTNTGQMPGGEGVGRGGMGMFGID